MKSNLIVTVMAFSLSVTLFAAGPGGTPPSGAMPSDGMSSGNMPGGAGGVFSYDSVISATTNSDGSVSHGGIVVGYPSSSTKFRPDSSITALVDGAFSGNTVIKTVNLKSSSITEIPPDCFAGCTSLRKVLLPDTVVKIGSGAFAGCTSLVYAVGAGLEEIGDDAFRDCTALTTAPLTNEAVVGTCAFANCPLLVEFAAKYSGNGNDLWPADDEYDGSAACVYNGWIVDGDGAMVGTVQVKAGKSNAKTSTFTATATVKDVNSKTWNYTKGTGDDEGEVTGLSCSAKNAAVASFAVQLGENHLSGEWGDCKIVGARQGMATKGDDMYTALTNFYRTSWSLAFTNELGYTRLRAVVGNGGVARITGTVATNLTASASVQSVMGSDALYIPYIATIKSGKNVHYANLLVRLNEDGSVEVLASSFGGLAAGGLTTDEIGTPTYEESEVSQGGECFSAVVSVADLAYPVRFTAKNLPAGLKINASTGEIYGVPTKPGAYTVTVTVKSVLNSKSTATLVLPITVANYVDELIPVQDSYGAFRVGVKVYRELADVAEGCAVSGLPTGLKFATKDTKDTAYGFGTVPAYTVYGVPTKAITNTVYFTKTIKETNVAGKAVSTSHKASATFMVEGLDAWAAGTFTGAVFDEGTNVAGLVSSATVSSTGKLSGKLVSEGLTWTIASVAYDSYDESNATYAATVVGKSGKASFTNSVTVCGELVDETARGVMFDDSGEWAAWQNIWKSDPWKTLAKPFANKKLTLYVDGDGKVAADEPESTTGMLTLKFASSGTVTVAGVFAYENLKTAKTANYSVSCSSTLVPQGGDLYALPVHFAAKTTSTMDFSGFSAEIPLVWDGAAFTLRW